MNLRQTHTYAVMEVPEDVYRDIRRRFVEAGYDHVFDGSGPEEIMDMHGVALRVLPAPAGVPVTVET